MQSHEEFALYWVNTFGWYIFPVHGITDDLQCTCGNPQCDHKGKHPYAPLAPNGHNSSSNDPNQVKAWWIAAPNANIGVDCGKSNITVLDCDGAEGTSILQNWCAGFGLEDLPPTLHIRTGGGGEHFIYDSTGQNIKSMNGYIEHNDVKSQGGYVVLPDSFHSSGRYYEVLENMYPAPLPDLLVLKLKSSKSGGAYESTRAPGSPSYVFSEAWTYGAKAGYRDEFFNSLAFRLKKDGYTPEQAVDKVKQAWELTEQPPGDEFTLGEAMQKLMRVYDDDSVKADEIPEWPLGFQTPVTGQSNTTDSGVSPTSPDLAEIMGSHPLTDRGNGHLLASIVKDRWMYADKDWYEWSGGIWIVDERNRIYEEARRSLDVMHEYGLGRLGMMSLDKRETLLKWTTQSSSLARHNAMISLATTDDSVARLVTNFDTNPWILTALNCTIDLRTGEGYESRPSDMCTKRTSVAYDRGYRDARWDAYLNCTFNGDPDMILYMQRVIGSALSGVVRDKSLYMGVGPKNTGKTTFINTLRTILGDYCMFIQPEYLMHSRMSNIPPYEIARMRAMRLLISDEPAAGARFNESLMKQITGNSTMVGARKYHAPIEFQPTFTLFVTGNQETNVRDDALKARIVEIPMIRQLQPNEQDSSVMIDAQDTNSSFCRAALAWAVEGCAIWSTQGLGEPPLAIQFATADYVKDQDIVGQMIDELLIPAPSEKVRMGSFYNTNVKAWFMSRGENPWTRKTVYDALKNREEIRMENGQWGWEILDYQINESALAWPGMGI
jgi:putative DNA primase/helicase